MIASRDSHILKAEAGAASALSGLQIKTIGSAGTFEADDVRRALHRADVHLAPTTLLALENTHNAAGGRVFPPTLLDEVARAAREAGLALHLDGARLWNAAVALARPIRELAAPFDTVSVCLSKGLGAPVGSLVAGSHALVERLRRIRKMYGGGMRQAGVLAVAGLFALEHQVARLAEDHANARRLARGLTWLGFAVEGEPETNLVMFGVAEDLAVQRAARERGVLLSRTDPGRLRAVTHLDVSAADIDEALDRFAALAPG